MDEFGKFVHQQRIAFYGSPKWLAEAVGCHPSFIRGIERGSQNASLTMARSILTMLNVDFIQGDGELTLKLNDGRIFQFNTEKRGQNKIPANPSTTSGRIADLEARLTSLEQLCSERNCHDQ